MKVSEVLPVRVEFDYNAPAPACPQFYAALITTRSGRHQIIPIGMHLVSTSLSRSPKMPIRIERLKEAMGWNISSGLPGSTQIVQAFKESPTLICSDVQILSHALSVERLPCRYQDVWVVRPRLGGGGILPNNFLTADPYGWLEKSCGRELYRSTEILMNRLLELGLDITFNAGDPMPTKPLARIRLGDFTLSKPQPISKAAGLAQGDVAGAVLNTLSNRTAGIGEFGPGWNASGAAGQDVLEGDPLRPEALVVDGRPSCALFADCSLPPEAGSILCIYHAQFSGQLAPHPHEGKQSHNPACDCRQVKLAGVGIQPQPSKLDRAGRSNLSWLVEAYLERPDVTWVIDFEFINLTLPRSGIPFELTIRTIRGRELLSTLVNYNSASLADVRKAAEPFLTKNDKPEAQAFRSGQLERLLNKHYRNGSTEGLSIEQLRQAIYNLGFSHETHTILSYGGGVDSRLFTRVLAGNDSLIVPSVPVPDIIGEGGRQCFEPISVLQLCRRLLPGRPQYMQSCVHRLLCPRSKITEYHRSSEDTGAMAEIIQVLVNSAP